MKKLIALLLTLVLVLSLAACAASQSTADDTASNDSASDAPTGSDTTENTPTDAPAEALEIADAKQLLDTVWETYTEEEQFPAAGGDYSEEHTVDGAPGYYTIADASELDRVFGLPEAEAANVDGAASLMHMMNANNFTGGAFHLTGEQDLTALAEATRENIQNRQWMCGFPDKLSIAAVGDYLVTCFGLEENVNTFMAKLQQVFPTAQILADEPIV